MLNSQQVMENQSQLINKYKFDERKYSKITKL